MKETGLTHGGDWAGFEREYGKEPLDFSMNVNPLGIPAGVQKAITEAAARADRYPDPLCRELIEKLARYENVRKEWIFCGNGAADIIFRLALALKPREHRRGTLLVTAPTFSEYETAFASCGWRVRRHALKEEYGFHLREDILDSIDEETDAVFLCEPNNPTGIATDPLLLQEILKRCGETDTVFVTDECFNGFLEAPETQTMKPALAENCHLIVLKAFTKLYGMAGVRLGYCLCGNRKIMESLRSCGAPWNVSALAQAAGIAALDERDFVRQGTGIVASERPRMKAALTELTGGQVYGEANYLLFQSRPDLDLRMREQGILIRNCSNYPGLGEGWFRVAVRRPEENRLLMEALQTVIKS